LQCGLALSPHNQEKKLYVDSGCSKYMTGEKRKFMSLMKMDRASNATFQNNASVRIKGKGVVSFD